MYSENLPRQEDILRVLGSVECSLNQKECVPDAVICNKVRIKPIFPNALSVGLQTSVSYDPKLIFKTSTNSLILLQNPFYEKEFPDDAMDSVIYMEDLDYC